MRFLIRRSVSRATLNAALRDVVRQGHALTRLEMGEYLSFGHADKGVMDIFRDALKRNNIPYEEEG